ITAFAVISAVSFLLLVPWEWTRRDPIVDIRLLFSRQFGMSFLVMMAVGAVLFSTTQLLPQLQQTTFDYTATLSGLSMMPGGIAMLMLMPISGFAAGIVQPRYL
ncbi:MAG: EmrB/QacA family drug resistance transporter, partial [Mesorhizobium sp.]